MGMINSTTHLIRLLRRLNEITYIQHIHTIYTLHAIYVYSICSNLIYGSNFLLHSQQQVWPKIPLLRYLRTRAVIVRVSSLEALLSKDCLCWQHPWDNNKCGHSTTNSWTHTMCPTLWCFKCFPVRIALSAPFLSGGRLQGLASPTWHQPPCAVQGPL